MASPSSTLDANPRKPRRWFTQISLRTLFIVLTVGCIWLAIVTKRARDQQLAVERILSLGGHVQYDYEQAAQRQRTTPIAPGWPWLRRLIGPHYFQTVVRVNLDSSAVSDADLRLIGKLRSAQTLSFNSTQVSDAGLAHLRNCRRAEYLGLAQTKVTSDGLVYVAAMSELDSLILQEAPVDDRGLEHLRELSRLTLLNVSNTLVSSEGVGVLAKLPSLRGLYLSWTPVDDGAVPHLIEMKNLGEVSVHGTRLSGAALLELDDARPDLQVDADAVDCSDMTFDGAKVVAFGRIAERIQALHDENRLKLVDLSGSQVTDQHLSRLRGLNKLEMLDLRDTGVTDEGVKALSEAIPNCQIRR